MAIANNKDSAGRDTRADGSYPWLVDDLARAREKLMSNEITKVERKIKEEYEDSVEPEADKLVTKIQGSKYTALIIFVALQAAFCLGYIVRGYLDIVIK